MEILFDRNLMSSISCIVLITTGDASVDTAPVCVFILHGRSSFHFFIYHSSETHAQ